MWRDVLARFMGHPKAIAGSLQVPRGEPTVSQESSRAPERHGSGTTVMEAMAERNVAGAVDLDYAAPGADRALGLPRQPTR